MRAWWPMCLFDYTWDIIYFIVLLNLHTNQLSTIANIVLMNRNGFDDRFINYLYHIGN